MRTAPFAYERMTPEQARAEIEQFAWAESRGAILGTGVLYRLLDALAAEVADLKATIARMPK
jgi:hypothetical protein